MALPENLTLDAEIEKAYDDVVLFTHQVGPSSEQRLRGVAARLNALTVTKLNRQLERNARAQAQSDRIAKESDRIATRLTWVNVWLAVMATLLAAVQAWPIVFE